MPSPAERPASPPAWQLAAWGLLWAVAGVAALHLVAPDPLSYMPARAVSMERATDGLEATGLPLLALVDGERVAVGTTDDQGLYVVVSYLAKWTGAEPLTAARILWLGAWALVLLASPLVTARLFASRLAIAVLPPATLVAIVSFGLADIYWVAAWAVLALVPCALLLWRRTAMTPATVAALVLIALVAGAVTTLRSNAGLPVLLAVAIVLVARVRPVPLAALAVVLAAIAYWAPGGLGLEALRDHRDNRADAALSADAPASHPFWHTAYIGLGYLPNDEGIRYADTFAARAAKQDAPEAAELSPAYEAALRERTLELIGDDPPGFAWLELRKLVVALMHALPYLLLLALVAPALLRLGRTDLRRLVWCAAPAVVVGALPALLAVPYRPYLTGLFGGLALLGLVGVGATADRLVASGLPRPTRRALAIAAAVVVAAGLVGAAGLTVEDRHQQWNAGHVPATG